MVLGKSGRTFACEAANGVNTQELAVVLLGCTLIKIYEKMQDRHLSQVNKTGSGKPPYEAAPSLIWKSQMTLTRKKPQQQARRDTGGKDLRDKTRCPFRPSPQKNETDLWGIQENTILIGEMQEFLDKGISNKS